MAGVNVLKHEAVSIRDLGHDENWVHAQILANPSILGLGDLTPWEHERRHRGAGRLDILLEDPEDDPRIRYETEIQLGESNGDHIFRCIDYWDREKQRWPGYKHRPVLVAEDFTRFFRVIQLIGSTAIPFLALQMTALRTDHGIVLHFTKVLDLEPHAPEEEEEEERAPSVGPEYYEGLSSRESMQLVDSLLGILREQDGQMKLDYSKARIRAETGGRLLPIKFNPKRKWVDVTVDFRDEQRATESARKLDGAGIRTRDWGQGSITFRLTPDVLQRNEEVVKEMLEAAYSGD